MNFVPSFPVVRFKLPHCLVSSKIIGKQENLQLFMSEKSLELPSTSFVGNSQIIEISRNKCWKKRQQLHDCFYMQKKSADLSFEYIEEWLVNVAKIVSALKLSFIWSKDFYSFFYVIMGLGTWKAKKQLLLFTLLMTHWKRGSSLFFLPLLKGQLELYQVKKEYKFWKKIFVI